MSTKLSIDTTPTASESNHESTPETRSEPSDLPLDEVFGVLSNERRRQVLRYLRDESDTTTLGDLAEHIAAIENDKPERTLTSTERKRVYICLYQSHLPKLDDLDVVDFDEDRKSVEVGATMGEVTRFLPDEPDADAGSADGGSDLAGTISAYVRTMGSRLRGRGDSPGSE